MKERKKVIASALRLPADDPYNASIGVQHEAFFSCERISQQVATLQNILRNKSELPSNVLLPFLSTVYLAADPPQAAALRRICYGALREFPLIDVSSALHNRLMVLMERAGTAQDVNPCSQLDELSLLAVWHPHGLQTLRIDLSRVLIYLAAALKYIKILSRRGSQERERGFNYASKVARCAAALSKGGVSNEKDRDVLRQICTGIKELLIDESTMLSCRLACGVSLPELIRATSSSEDSSGEPREVYVAHSDELLAVPLAHVCFISGMINITPIDNVNDLRIYEELLSDLDRLGNRQELQQEAPFALTCVRTVLQWTEKLCKDGRGSSREVFERRFEDLLRIAFSNIEHFVDAVQHQGKALFKVTVENMVKNPDPKHIESLKRTFIQLLSEPHYRKAKYAPLQIIAKHIKVHNIINATAVLEVYQTLQEKNMLPYVEDFIRDVGGKCLLEDPQSWNAVWVEPFFTIFDSNQCSATVKNLLPGLLRLQPALADEILSRSNNQRYLLLALEALSPDKLFECPRNLENAQWPTDESVRHSLLRLLTECPKSCEPIDPRAIPHLKTFLELNISTQSQALRQAMFSSFKKLLQRAADSNIYWRKPGKKHEVYGEKGIEDVLRQGEELVTHFWLFCLSQLHPGCSFFTRSTALMLLELMAPLARNDQWTQTKAHTLLYWLKDTYERNKTAVVHILLTGPRHLLPFANSEKVLNEWLEHSVILTRSARPPDGVTASYILRVLAKTSREQIIQGSTASPEDQVFLRLFAAILPELRNQVQVALNQGLLEASSSAPMYSALLCVRTLFNEAFSCSLNLAHIEEYRVILQEILDLSYKITSVASPLVTHPSPEGRVDFNEHPEIVEQFKAALNRGFGKRLHNADAVKTWAVAAQMMLLCSWRSHREISLCFGDIASHLGKVTALKILPEEEFVKMGVYFMNELCRVRHRGAFEQASMGFSRLCYSLWRHPDERLRRLPEEWLDELMSRVASGEVSATRRSAGLPFIVQSIVVTEPEVNANGGLRRAMTGLLPLAAGEDEKARVHALNVLRALYRDTQLGESVMGYVSSGLCSALRGFSHPAWHVRNASTLLFSSLMTRIFGVNRSRQDIERKNCLTGNVFFQRFPELLPFLLERIAELLKHIEGHTGLYPILLLLERLIPSLTDSKLGAFMPLLDVCAGSSLHGIRVASSKAYASLLPAESRLQVLIQKMRMLAAGEGKIGENRLHGTLLQIRAVLTMSEMSSELTQALSGPLMEGAWIAAPHYGLAAAEYIRLLTSCSSNVDKVLEIVPKADLIIPGGDQFQAALIKYKLTCGVPVDARTDSEKAAAFEFCLEHGSVSSAIELMNQVIQSPDKEHPDVQRMAYELATLNAGKLDRLETRVLILLDRLSVLTHPSVAVALFGLVSAFVPRLKGNFLRGVIDALRKYSAPNQDPDMRRVAADLAYNLLKAHGEEVFVRNAASHICLTQALVNLVLDNDVYIRDRIIDGVATINADLLCRLTPLEAVLAICSKTTANPQAFGQFLVELASVDDDRIPALDNSQDQDSIDGNIDEQPFEKGELNTFYDTLVIAESCRRTLEELRPRLVGDLNMPTLTPEQSATIDKLETQVLQTTDYELASNRQLDRGLVLLGQKLTAQSMVVGRLQICERPLINNMYFSRFAKFNNCTDCT
ncbi:thyroid adenoma-associated protein homolog isoform X5 [Varroa destructor]|uniref:tRNA (32-2'-O)-methyltransferase regulator THADA n=1 Tax=Varroa destructor TaxID=109461 RepID=A0A7M7K8P1_VARDE|nr:thyroid adenoma-associated protein homolog isoform X5 [Varroa destructor]